MAAKHLRNPDYMLEWIERDAWGAPIQGHSKYYELKLEDLGNGLYDVMVSHGRLGKSGKTFLMSSTRAGAFLPADKRTAERAMANQASTKTRKGYSDVTRRGTYSIGLDSPDAAWVPTLKRLQKELGEADTVLRGLQRVNERMFDHLKPPMDDLTGRLEGLLRAH
jgi:predicted DNA-binding WGR domain protein